MARATLLLLLVVLATACPTFIRAPSSGVTSIEVKGPYVHGPSGFIFPESFGAFRRAQIGQFDSAGTNVGVGYNLDHADAQIAVTLYVFPPDRDAGGAIVPLARQFELAKADVLKNHAGATVASTWTPPPTENHEAAPGFAARFHYEELFAHRQQEVESLLCLFEHDGWVVKYRITYSSAQQARAGPAAEAFVSTLPWRGDA